jgi:cytochrome c oxidase cbb3-type subunit 3/ubiquinol-cytochrome c reductase cytochrome c subunit
MMRSAQIRIALGALAFATACAFTIGCGPIPGRPGPGPEVLRPEEVLAFPALYKQNCAACHGENGKNGAAISLANPVFIELAGETHLRDVIAHGVPGKLMPAFAASSGGMLTDAQVTALAQGIVKQWGTPGILQGQSPPPYLASLPGNPEHGQQAYAVFCARCHGTTGESGPADGIPGPDKAKLGSIVDPSYLALISDQNLRSVLIAGRPDQAMPDWRNDIASTLPQQPMTDQQITDILAWMAARRVANPGQPYSSHP